MATYMLPQLEDDEILGPVADQLVVPTGGANEVPAGVDALRGGAEEEQEAPVDVANLINLVTRRDKRVKVPGTNTVITKGDVKVALKEAIVTGVKDKRRDERDADKLAAPDCSRQGRDQGADEGA